MRVLVVKTTSMGDVVHTLPAITDMARCVPDIAIDWLVEAPFAAIPALHPAVDQVFAIAWRKWRKTLHRRETRAAIAALRERLRARRYDLVIDFQGLLKSVMWAKQARGPLVGYDRHSIREPLAALFYERRAHVPWSLHAVPRCRRLAAFQLGYPDPTDEPNFGLRAPVEPAWRTAPPYAVFIPCASRPEKLWPEDRWRHLTLRCQGIGITPVLLWGSAAERALAERIAQGTDAVLPPFLSVGDTAAVLAGAGFIVGLDTGFTHLGAAFARPTVGIYCDHEPGEVGVTGPALVQSLGGRGQVPAIADVEAAFDAAVAASIAAPGAPSA